VHVQTAVRQQTEAPAVMIYEEKRSLLRSYIIYAIYLNITGQLWPLMVYVCILLAGLKTCEVFPQYNLLFHYSITRPILFVRIWWTWINDLGVCLLLINIISHGWPAGVVAPSNCSGRRQCPICNISGGSGVELHLSDPWQMCLGRPGRRFQCGLLSGRPPPSLSTASRIAIRPGWSDQESACLC